MGNGIWIVYQKDLLNCNDNEYSQLNATSLKIIWPRRIKPWTELTELRDTCPMPEPTPISSLQKFPLPSIGPEDVLIGEDGQVYAGSEDGWIYQLDPATGDCRTLVNTRGRPLGLAFDPLGNLVICDSDKGLLSFDLAQQTLETLTGEAEGRRLNFCNNADIAADGRIFFSESSTRYRYGESSRDVIEQIPTGSLFCRYPDGRVVRVTDGLLFANGVCLSPDESFVLVAETGAARIQRFDLEGPDAGKLMPFAQDLPGLPDNLSLGSDGLVWVALVVPKTEKFTKIISLPPWLRKLVARLPDRLKPPPDQCLRVLAFDLHGRKVHDFEGDPVEFSEVTGVRESNGYVYLGSLTLAAVARFKIDGPTSPAS